MVVDKFAYVLLAFFIGGLGAHKFYAKKTGWGVVYLLFCWTGIPGVIAIIEAIIAVFKPSDNGKITV
ncbi:MULTISPECIES: NINE protein [unclassified Staphylococcus]|uniref:TM2 domain-containing protein n=1 Tax=unclassified Staphylococcus TaxID=91994 RepID=UPI0021CEB65D|nr:MULTISPECIES: NINE protein [unclassified Staphylococcus]UXR78450.1 NINE protein [Staphylococcus sp. IVB6227]UXR82608.1 NINE protein [Staphylococcus sp. IVB6214]